jgi:hypothetical protein
LFGKFENVYKYKKPVTCKNCAVTRRLAGNRFLFLLGRCNHGFSPDTFLRGMWCSRYLYVLTHSKRLFTGALQPWILSRMFSGGMWCSRYLYVLTHSKRLFTGAHLAAFINNSRP